MKTDEFQQLLKSPQRIAEWSVDELRELALAHPYSQIIQLLYSLRLRFSSEHLFNQQLSRTALLTNDRRVLFELFEQKPRSSVASHRAKKPESPSPTPLRKVSDEDELMPEETAAETTQNSPPKLEESLIDQKSQAPVEDAPAHKPPGTEPPKAPGETEEQPANQVASEEEKQGKAEKATAKEEGPKVGAQSAVPEEGSKGGVSLATHSKEAPSPEAKAENQVPQFAPGASVQERMKAILEHNRALREAYAREKEEAKNALPSEDALEKSAEDQTPSNHSQAASAEKDQSAGRVEATPRTEASAGSEESKGPELAAQRDSEEPPGALAPEPPTETKAENAESEAPELAAQRDSEVSPGALAPEPPTETKAENAESEASELAAQRDSEEPPDALASERGSEAKVEEEDEDISLTEYLDQSMQRIQERLKDLESRGNLSAERLAALREAQQELSAQRPPSPSEEEDLDQEWQAIAEQAEVLSGNRAKFEETKEVAEDKAEEEEPVPPAASNEDPRVEDKSTPLASAQVKEEDVKGEEEDFSAWLRRLKNQNISEWQQSEETNKGAKAVESIPPMEEKLALLDSFVEKLPSLKRKPLEETTKTEEPSVPAPAATRGHDHQLVTETLAEVYLSQKHYKKALQAYEILRLKYPEKSSFFAARIKEIKKLAHSPLE